MFLTCWRIRRDLTALADGELPGRRAAAVRAHLACCPACAAFDAGVTASLARQRCLLPRAAAAPEVVVEALLRDARRRIVDEPPEAPAFPWPPVLAAAALSLVIFVLVNRVGAPRPGSPVQSGPRVAARKPAAMPAASDAADPQAPQAVARGGAAPTPDEDELDLDHPPELLAEQPELFRDYRFFQRLEAIEHYETVQNQPLPDTAAGPPPG